MKSYEIEQKYRIAKPDPIRKRLRSLGAKRISSGTEQDWFYDLDGRLLKQRSILRLRKTAKGEGLLTFKGPRIKARYKKRVEVQTAVDFDAAKKVLELSGFKVSAKLQKQREEYKLGGAHITLDYLAGIGWFVEIEAAAKNISTAAKKLLLTSAMREERSYLQMFLEDSRLD